MTTRKTFLPVPVIQANEGSGPLAGQTTNYAFNLINFDWITWHDYEWANWVQVDTLLKLALSYLDLQGVWQPQTAYLAGQSVYDPNDFTSVYRCSADHTSGDTFDGDKDTYWELIDKPVATVNSVFGRQGDIIADVSDYAAFYVTNDDLTWNNIGGKPSTYPPSEHTHDSDEITNTDFVERTGDTITGDLHIENDLVVGKGTGATHGLTITSDLPYTYFKDTTSGATNPNWAIGAADSRFTVQERDASNILVKTMQYWDAVVGTVVNVLAEFRENVLFEKDITVEGDTLIKGTATIDDGLVVENDADIEGTVEIVSDTATMRFTRSSADVGNKNWEFLQTHDGRFQFREYNDAWVFQETVAEVRRTGAALTSNTLLTKSDADDLYAPELDFGTTIVSSGTINTDGTITRKAGLLQSAIRTGTGKYTVGIGVNPLNASIQIQTYGPNPVNAYITGRDSGTFMIDIECLANTTNTPFDTSFYITVSETVDVS